MKVLHTGDLHLDGAFCSYGQRDAEAQREQSRELLANIFAKAKEEGCELILIAGDLFDSKFVSEKTGELFCSLVEKSGLTVVVAPGNHDHYFENSFYEKAAKRLGERLVLFTSPELQVFELEEKKVKLFGYAFTSAVLKENPLDGAFIQNDGYLHIFCAHGDLDEPLSNKAPLSKLQLEGLGFDYVALGHTHNVGDCEDEEGRIRYCGFPEGRGFDELGEGRVWIVDVEREGCKAKKISLSKRAFYIINAEINFDDGVAVAEEEICAAVTSNGCGKGARVRIILEGSGEPVYKNELLRISEAVVKKCGVDYAQIIDRRLPELDGELLMKDATLRGELYRVLRPKLMSDSEEERAVAVKALKIGLAAIDGRSVYEYCE